MKRAFFIGFIALCVAIICFTYYWRSSNEPMDFTKSSSFNVIVTQKTTFEVPGYAYIAGRDLSSDSRRTIKDIQIWNNANRQALLCILKHGQRVKLIESHYHSEERKYYFKIDANECIGWLAETYLSLEKQEPVGVMLHDSP